MSALPKVTWWFGPSPQDNVEKQSDEALETTVSMVRTLVRIAHGEAIVKSEPPVFRMWKHHLLGLHVYGCLASMEATMFRGMEDSFYEFSVPARKLREAGDDTFALPPWQDDEDVIRSHVAAAHRAEDPVVWVDEDHMVDLEDEDQEFWPLLWPIMTGPEEYELRVSKGDREAMESDELWLPDHVRERVVNLDG